MGAQKIAAVLLLLAGALALVYCGFTYTRETHTADIGSLHVSMDEKQHVNVPIWAGFGVMLIGGVLLLAGTRR
jgi:hypothetical protein